MGEVLVQAAGGKSEARYGWSKAPITGYTIQSSLTRVITFDDDDGTFRMFIADSFDTTTLLLINPQEIVITPGVTTIPANKYVATYGVRGPVTYQNTALCTAGSGSYGILSFNPPTAKDITAKIGNVPVCAVSDNAGEYPANAIQDGYKYVAVLT